MSLITHIEKLREKPEHVRRRIAFWYAFGTTFAIFMIWLASFAPLGKVVPGGMALGTIGQAETPTTSLVAAVGSFYTDIKELVFGPKKVKYSSVQILPGDR